MEHDLPALTRRRFDLLVVGGGIVGAFAAWDATLRGLRVALVEAREPGAGTSANSLKTIHGGLRYLQRLDLAGLRESVRERRALLRIAPALVQPLSFVVPAASATERARLAVGVTLYDLLSADRNEGVPGDRRLRWSRALGPASLRELVPALGSAADHGGALWQDAQLDRGEALVAALLQAAAARGAVAASDLEALTFLREGDRVTGARVRDARSGREIDVRAAAVLAAVGHELDPLLLRSGLPKLDVPWLSAINLVLRTPAPSTAAVGGRVRGRHLFLVPWRGIAMVGTDYAPASSATEERVTAFLADAVSAFPWVPMTRDDVTTVHHGWVPGTSGDALWSHDRVFDHTAKGAPGLFSAVAGKLTTARALAETAIDAVFRGQDLWVPPCRTAVTPVA